MNGLNAEVMLDHCSSNAFFKATDKHSTWKFFLLLILFIWISRYRRANWAEIWACEGYRCKQRCIGRISKSGRECRWHGSEWECRVQLFHILLLLKQIIISLFFMRDLSNKYFFELKIIQITRIKHYFWYIFIVELFLRI